MEDVRFEQGFNVLHLPFAENALLEPGCAFPEGRLLVAVGVSKA